MIRKGDTVEIKPEFQDSGDSEFNWIALEDEDGGRVRISPTNTSLSLPPNYVVNVSMLKEQRNPLIDLIEELREAFSHIKRIDPCSATYQKMTDLLDRMDDDGLKVTVAADIRFVSALARNRCVRRGIRI